MKIGSISDGKFGDRAFEIIREKYPTGLDIICCRCTGEAFGR